MTAEHVTVASITDGDTFRTTTGERIRIAGIDAPETHGDQARCAQEIERGRAASDALFRLIQGREITIERVGRSYNRTVAKVRRGRMDIAAELVREGVARQWPRQFRNLTGAERERVESFSGVPVNPV